MRAAVWVKSDDKRRQRTVIPGPSVTQLGLPPMVTIWQNCPPELTAMWTDNVGAFVDGESVGGMWPVAVGAMVVGDRVGDPPEKQIVQPSFVTEPSLCHVNVEPAATATSSGPMLPWYRVPPMVTWSQQLSVSNCVAVTNPAAATRMVQSSSSP